MSHESLPGVTRSSSQLPQTHPDSLAAKRLGMRTYVSVPVVLAKHELYGMVCGASRMTQPISERLVSVMEFFAEMIADHVTRTRVAATEERADLAEEELRARARFLAAAEHQLKTPLTVIQGAAGPPCGVGGSRSSHPGPVPRHRGPQRSRSVARHLRAASRGKGGCSEPGVGSR